MKVKVVSKDVDNVSSYVVVFFSLGNIFLNFILNNELKL